jgi:hypothetical protein
VGGRLVGSADRIWIWIWKSGIYEWGIESGISDGGDLDGYLRLFFFFGLFFIGFVLLFMAFCFFGRVHEGRLD